jgi:putative heme iron utilization protein
MAEPTPRPGAASAWTHRRFFSELGPLSPLRVISQCGASTFEAICRFGPFGFADGHMNAITPEYHWHVSLARFGHLASVDRTHARSGRRVLFFELREKDGAAPFLSIYLYRDRGAEFDAEREQRFAALHAELRAGVALAREGDDACA